MIAREKILIGLPTYDYKVDSALMLGSLACTKYFSTMPLIYGGGSYVQTARNQIAHTFVEERKECDWLMWIDSDIRFTTRDWELLWEGEDLVVTAEYAKKIFGMPPAQFGLGFTRVHRSVYEKIRDWKNEEGQEIIRRYHHEGRRVVDYHTQHVSSDERFNGEDHAFFKWCAALGVPTRVETRTRLGHVGQYCYGYPDQIPAETLARLILTSDREAVMKEIDRLEGAQ